MPVPAEISRTALLVATRIMRRVYEDFPDYVKTITDNPPEFQWSASERILTPQNENIIISASTIMFLSGNSDLYEQALESPACTACDKDDIGLIYEGRRVETIVEGRKYIIGCSLTIYMHHPEEYKEALRQAGSLKMFYAKGTEYETLSCG